MITNNDREYRNDEEIEALVHEFESFRIEPAHFKHRQHLTVALVYVRSLGERLALEKLRTNILKFVEHNHIDPVLYHETITRFWIKRIYVFLKSQDEMADRSLATLANVLLLESGDSRLINRYYSQGLLDSDDARKNWIEPDRIPFDF